MGADDYVLARFFCLREFFAHPFNLGGIESRIALRAAILSIKDDEAPSVEFERAIFPIENLDEPCDVFSRDGLGNIMISRSDEDRGVDLLEDGGPIFFEVFAFVDHIAGEEDEIGTQGVDLFDLLFEAFEVGFVSVWAVES